MKMPSCNEAAVNEKFVKTIDYSFEEHVIKLPGLNGAAMNLESVKTIDYGMASTSSNCPATTPLPHIKDPRRLAMTLNYGCWSARH